jgi:hypothetical protein
MRLLPRLAANGLPLSDFAGVESGETGGVEDEKSDMTDGFLDSLFIRLVTALTNRHWSSNTTSSKPGTAS